MHFKKILLKEISDFLKVHIAPYYVYTKELNLRVLCLLLTNGIRYYCKTSYRKYLSLDVFDEPHPVPL